MAFFERLGDQLYYEDHRGDRQEHKGGTEEPGDGNEEHRGGSHAHSDGSKGCSGDNRETALVLAHGMGGNHAIWYQQLAALAQSFRVITFDHRGFGNSSDRAGLGRSGYVEDLRALLDHLHIERAVLVGQSMGGGTCIGFSCEYPDRVLALVVADSLHGLVESPEVAAIMDGARAATAALGQVERVLGRRIREQRPEAAVLYRQINSFNAVTRHTLKGELRRYPPAQLAATRIPVLFIAGTEDVLFPVTAIRLVQQQVSGSRLLEIEGVGHSAFYEAPAQFNAALLTALQFKNPA